MVTNFSLRPHRLETGRNKMLRTVGNSTSMRRSGVRAQAQAGDKLVSRPEMKKPESSAVTAPPAQSASPSAPSSVPSSPATASGPLAPGAIVTIEYQRQRAKEMTKYFKELKTQEQILQTGTVLGWTRPNEIANGRWVSNRSQSFLLHSRLHDHPLSEP